MTKDTLAYAVIIISLASVAAITVGSLVSNEPDTAERELRIPVYVVEPEPGIRCAVIDDPSGVAIDCWKVEPNVVAK